MQSTEQLELCGVQCRAGPGDCTDPKPKSNCGATPGQLIDCQLFEDSAFDSAQLRMRHRDPLARLPKARARRNAR